MQPIKVKKGNVWVYTALLVVALLVMIFTRNLSRNHVAGIPGSAQGDSISIGIQLSPLGISTNGDTLGGFYYDMVRQMAQREHLRLKIDGFTQISTALEALDEGVYDVVISDIPITETLRDKYAFTDPIYADRQVLVQMVDSVTGEPPIKTQTDLRGKTVHIAAESPFLPRLRNLSHEIGDTIYVEQDEQYGPEQMMLLTALGKVDNVVVNEHTAQTIAKDYPQLDISLTLSFNQLQSWAVAPRHKAQLDSLNVWIGRFKATPAFDRLVDRYFNEAPLIK